MFNVLKMSDIYVLKLSVETEAEKYLAVVIPQMKLNSFVCATYLLAIIFLLNDFWSICTWRNISIIFQTKEKILSQRISRELLTVFGKIPMHEEAMKN